ncbi:winged helix-turn-helix domain-containing protein [Vibrio paucivorans]|uniref:Winged helix-turn-helix domain-containing protein n=1 Tax=Vibrio paucivorans TaxID=2829489 RepID=A0A9X3CD75_9VIBR|nr:winged helix-turn-helix domain-containing protein [Vibrio paucivorans]MCW8333095.1 winged helix-turn-helix domain-containing protein [Vibrio paucivorans]
MVSKATSFNIDEWSFIPNEGQIVFSDKTINIDKRLSKLLEFFCQNPGQTHTRDELIENVWNGMILTDQVVTQAVFELRKVLKQNSTKNESYIITVPKRGYKFFAEVGVSYETSNSGVTDYPQPETRPEIKEDTAPSTKTPTPRTKPWLPIALATIICFETGYILYSTLGNQTSPPISQPTRLGNFESRYVVLEISDDIQQDPVLFGVVTKFIEYVGYYSNIRIVHSPELQKIAAIELKLATSPSRDGQYTRLTMRYHNRVSNQGHLSRRYPTELASIHQTLFSMLDDMLGALYISPPKQELMQLLEQLPSDEAALEHVLTGIGYLYNGEPMEKALVNLRLAKQLAPDHDFTYTVNYIGEMFRIFNSNDSNKQQMTVALNDEYRDRLTRLLEQGKMPRVYDAMAMMALSEDNPEKAMRILLSLPDQKHSILSYLLLAKAEESRGNGGAAKELYLKATQSNSSLRAVQFASPLFFDSNLDPLLKEFE